MSTIAETAIEADPKVPIIWMRREFNALPEQLFRAHTDPWLFARWAGPNGMHTRIEDWDARSGGSWRYVSTRDGQQYAFRGCFEDRDAWLASGMEVGVNEGYAKLKEMLADGTV